MNEAGPGADWLARAGSPWLVPEQYPQRAADNGQAPDPDGEARSQLMNFDAWQGRAMRFGLAHMPLLGIGDGTPGVSHHTSDNRREGGRCCPS